MTIKYKNALKEMGYKEVQELAKNTSTPYPALSKNNKARKLTASILKSVSNHIEGGEDFTAEVQMLISYLLTAKKQGNIGATISTDTYSYTTDTTLNKQGVSYDRLVKVLNGFQEAGYGEFYKGGRNCVVSPKGRTYSYTSIMKFSDELLGRATEAMTSTFTIKTEQDLIEVKDWEGNLFTPAQLQHVRNRKPLQKGLKSFNEVVASGDIKCMEKPFYPVYKRTFTQDMNHHGRFYSNFQSAITSEEREFLSIKDGACCEVDYKSMHPRMLYTMAGVTVESSFDPYTITNKWDITDEECRDFMKVCFMSVLYNTSRPKAVNGIAQKLRSMSYKRPKANATEEQIAAIKKLNDFAAKFDIQNDAAYIVTSLENINEAIIPYFYEKKRWASLQNLDARMAEIVIAHFTNKGIILLPWHDSFVIQSIYKNELIALMKEAWETVLGNTNNCEVDIEFDNTPKTFTKEGNK